MMKNACLSLMSILLQFFLRVGGGGGDISTVTLKTPYKSSEHNSTNISPQIAIRYCFLASMQRVFIRHRRLKNSLVTTQNSPDKFCLFPVRVLPFHNNSPVTFQYSPATPILNENPACIFHHSLADHLNKFLNFRKLFKYM